MPNGSTFKQSQIVKVLLMGESGSGKTGSLASLALAGYKLRILEFDNGVDSLIGAVSRADPKKLSNIEYISLRDKIKSSQTGPEFDGTPLAFVDGMKLLDDWDPAKCTGLDAESRQDTKFGPPKAWGAECVLVIDSLTFLAQAALNYQLGMNPTAGQKNGANMLALYGTAQKAVVHVLGLITAKTFNTNVVVISHIEYEERSDGLKGLPRAIGKAINSDIPTYFNAMILSDIDQTTKKRRIQTVPTNMVDLKNPAAHKMQKILDVENGLAEFFKVLKE